MSNFYHKEKINGSLNETVIDEGKGVTLAQLVAEHKQEHKDAQNYGRTSAVFFEYICHYSAYSVYL
jgi:hypothetical protein